MILKHIDYEMLKHLLHAVVNIGKPFSMIRLGDGESLILGYPRFTSEKLTRNRINMWFPQSSMSRQDLRNFNIHLKEACLNADIIGVPSAHQCTLSVRWGNVRKYLKMFHLVMPKTRLFNVKAIPLMHRAGEFKTLFSGFNELHCITCRPIEKEIKNYFGVDKVHLFKIPPQRKPHRASKHARELIKNYKGKPHFPVLYREIKTWIQEKAGRGKVFLVGAGGLGKVYCMWIKQAGGIALDVGSLFDGWAGVYTRTYLKDLGRYKLK